MQINQLGKVLLQSISNYQDLTYDTMFVKIGQLARLYGQ